MEADGEASSEKGTGKGATVRRLEALVRGEKLKELIIKLHGLSLRVKDCLVA